MLIGTKVKDGNRVGVIAYISIHGLQVAFTDLTDVSPAVIKVTCSTVSYSNDAVEKFLEVV